jgi:hypothetical protein
VPAGEVQGAAQVTVNEVAEIVAGAMASVNTAAIDALVGAPAVGPGVLVAGVVNVTRGLIASGAEPAVMKLQVNGAASAIPVARLRAPVIVPV